MKHYQELLELEVAFEDQIYDVDVNIIAHEEESSCDTDRGTKRELEIHVDEVIIEKVFLDENEIEDISFGQREWIENAAIEYFVDEWKYGEYRK